MNGGRFCKRDDDVNGTAIGDEIQCRDWHDFGAVVGQELDRVIHGLRDLWCNDVCIEEVVLGKSELESAQSLVYPLSVVVVRAVRSSEVSAVWSGDCV